MPVLVQVSRIRGQIGRVDAPIVVSFEKEEDALSALKEQTLREKVCVDHSFSATVHMYS